MKPSELTPLTALVRALPPPRLPPADPRRNCPSSSPRPGASFPLRRPDRPAERPAHSFPPGVLNTVPSLGSVGGAALAAHPDVDKVAFTGSTLTGRKIMAAAAASNLKKVSLELGGKSPHLVFDSADLDQAANWAALGIMYNTGQDCTAGSRVYVQAGVYDKFVALLVQKAKELRIGDGFDDANGGGPVVSKTQYDRVWGFIEAGKKAGATPLVGGTKRVGKGFYVDPVIFTDITPDMQIVRAPPALAPPFHPRLTRCAAGPRGGAQRDPAGDRYAGLTRHRADLRARARRRPLRDRGRGGRARERDDVRARRGPALLRREPVRARRGGARGGHGVGEPVQRASCLPARCPGSHAARRSSRTTCRSAARSAVSRFGARRGLTASAEAERDRARARELCARRVYVRQGRALELWRAARVAAVSGAGVDGGGCGVTLRCCSVRLSRVLSVMSMVFESGKTVFCSGHQCSSDPSCQGASEQMEFGMYVAYI
jgi:hypothetical protein